MTEISDDEFHARIEILHYYKLKELQDFALESPSMTGVFYEKDLSYLKNYCEKHPEFHIVSIADDMAEHNCIIENMGLYYLCRGDKDPSLFCHPNWEEVGEVWIFISKLVRRTATPAEINEFKNKFNVQTIKH